MLSSIAIVNIVIVVVVHHAIVINVIIVAIIVVVHRAIIIVVVVVTVVAPLPSTSSLLPVASSPLLSLKPLSIAINIVDVVIPSAVVIIVDVRCTVAIVVDVVPHWTVAAIVGNGKTPAHQQWQQRYCNKGNNAIATMAKMPAHQQRWHHHNEGNSRTEDVVLIFLFLLSVGDELQH